MKFLLILLLAWPSWAGAEIYQWRDDRGNRHFSDRTSPEAKIVDIKPGYSFYRVKKVFDGDTVLLEDGRKIRLLGINTPEVRHRNEDPQAGGDEAKQWLINKLQNRKVRLETDVEKTDKYKRTLAHLFTENDEHINLQLVGAGLAAVSIYPPNLLHAAELIKAQDQAEQARSGIWQRAEYAAIPIGSLTDQGRAGWMRLAGKVVNIRNSRKYSYLEFSSSRFEARIERKWLPLFPDMNGYLGKEIEVRGWLNKNKNGFSMLIRHPSAIKLR
ncbi:thermonuclease family protein [Methylobacter sp. YRD-M1]|uniref:thermonuclease family protein n=1 Tax=Methylobacter sp. YRD-M1 TaxID=2911520 RepID=UPI00227C6E66|nr:thermonuclease family protein [Methylobacter sp. YRD-M1]WAK01380.1 thermonuclease family protein [Methylobacter sp. YRD-M1]